MSPSNGPEVPFPMKEPGVPFPMKEIFDQFTKFLSTFSGPRIPPIPGLPNLSAPEPRDGGAYPTAPFGYTETLGHAKYYAYRLGDAFFIKASGTLSNWNQIADIRMSPNKIYPPQFNFFIYSPTFTSPALREFKFSEQFGFPNDAEKCVIIDADGHHVLEIKNISAEAVKPAFLSETNEAERTEFIGYGDSLQAAFDAAVVQAGAQHPSPDAFVTYRTLDSGLVQGGIAGLHHYFSKIQVEIQA